MRTGQVQRARMQLTLAAGQTLTAVVHKGIFWAGIGGCVRIGGPAPCVAGPGAAGATVTGVVRAERPPGGGRARGAAIFPLHGLFSTLVSPLIPHENTQGRRVHVLAARAAPGPTSTAPLTWGAAARTGKSADVRDFLLYRLPPGQGPPRVVVLDHASCHCSQAMQQAQPQLWDEGIELYFLPPYSPELNDIEPSCGRVQHQARPLRSYTSTRTMIQAIHAAFRRVATDLLTRQSSVPTA